jgi:hypothetical protein
MQVVNEGIAFKIRKNGCSRTFIGWRDHQGLELTGCPSGEAGASSNITSRTNSNNTTHNFHPRTDNDTPKLQLRSKSSSRSPMASRVLRPAFRAINITARGFQTSAALRQERPLVAPVRRPVGAFRGG